MHQNPMSRQAEEEAKLRVCFYDIKQQNAKLLSA
jgi:hypothetical protein